MRRKRAKKEKDQEEYLEITGPEELMTAITCSLLIYSRPIVESILMAAIIDYADANGMDAPNLAFRIYEAVRDTPEDLEDDDEDDDYD